MSTIDAGLEKKIMTKLNKKPYSVSQLAKELNLRREFLTGFLEALRISKKLEVVDVGRAKVYRPMEVIVK